MRTAEITNAPIEPEAVLRQVGTLDDGAVLLFLGRVRRTNEGRAVTGMRYDAYHAMAGEVLQAIVAEAAERWGLEDVVAVHRVGELDLGEVSVATAVAAPHRGHAYAASRFIIEELKRRLPVWKLEHYQAGETRWLEGAVPPQAGS